MILKIVMISSGLMEQEIKLIAFDMGGVVAHHSDGRLEASLLKDFGLEGYNSFAELEPSLVDLLQEHSKSNIDEQTMWDLFTQKTGVRVPVSESSLWGKYFDPALDQAMLAIIDELKAKGYRVICTTNTEVAHYAIHRNNDDYASFDAVYASCVLRSAKPEQEFFNQVLKSEGIPPSQVLFIDDSSINCESAASLGIQSYHYTDPVDFRWYLNNIGIL